MIGGTLARPVATDTVWCMLLHVQLAARGGTWPADQMACLSRRIHPSSGGGLLSAVPFAMVPVQDKALGDWLPGLLANNALAMSVFLLACYLP